MSQQRNTPAAAPTATVAAPSASSLSDVERAILKRAEAQVAAKRATGADVLGVAEFGPSGAVRLTLRCKAPGCGKTHVRAIQDAHQAHLCPDCRKAADKSKKRAKRGDRREAAKTTIASLNAKLLAAETALREAQAANQS